MNKRVYVVEDMAISRAALIDTLEENGFEIAGSSASGDKAWLEIKDLDVDIALLDINLVGEKDGIWLAKMIRAHKNMPIIFLTAFGDEKTLSHLQEVEPNGYLMKPYNTPTLITLLDIASRGFKNVEQNRALKANATNPTVVIKEGSDFIKIDTSQIHFVKSDGNYLEIKMPNKKHIIREKLTEFLNELPKELFLQVHRRFAVNLNQVTMVSSNAILIGEVKIPVSKTYKKDLLEILKNQ